MNTTHYIAACCSLACLLAFSQAEADEGGGVKPAEVRIGLGASFGSDTLLPVNGDWIMLPVGFSNFYIPVIFSDIFTVEPEFGYFARGWSRSDPDSESSTSMLRIGLGLFYTPIRDRTAYHVGMRFGILSSSSSLSSQSVSGHSDSRSKEDFFIGPAVGAEYFFSEQFSLGMEVQLNYIKLGEWESEHGDGDDRDEYYFSNRTHCFLRFYFGTSRPTETVDSSGPQERPVKTETAVEQVAPEKQAKPQPAATLPPAEEAKEPAEEQAKPQPAATPPPAEEAKEPAEKQAKPQPAATPPPAEETKEPPQKKAGD